MTTIGIELISKERLRQIEVEGWTGEHDNQHNGSELAEAAACYLRQAMRGFVQIEDWPWADEWWKPSDDPIRNLVKAGALIAAEIDRLERMKRVG